MEREHWAEQTESEEYLAFVEKFKAKKTTDDCYTLDNVYEAVAGFVEKRYGIDRANFVRPFYPGGDFERFPYGSDSVVVDNPPFSILSKILAFYTARRIRFFLFADTRTCFSYIKDGVCVVPGGLTVTYENGAGVKTSFVTNLDNAMVSTEPELFRALDAANRENKRKQRKSLPKYVYPAHVLTTMEACKWCKCGVAFRLEKGEAVRIRALDAQRKFGKVIFGSGLLLSDKAAAEAAKAAAEADKAAAEAAKAAAEADKAAAEAKKPDFVWRLSARELEMVKELGRGGGA